MRSDHFQPHQEANEFMSTSTIELEPEARQSAEPDPFDLDIRVIEFGDEAAALIELTDDGCGSTCPKACVTNPG